MAESALPGLVVDIEGRVDKLEKAMARANSVIRSGSSTMEARAKQSAARIEATYAGAGASIANAVKGISGAFAGIVSAKAAQDLIDSSVKIQNQLKTTGLAGKDLKEVYDALFASAQKNATPLEALVTLYSRVSGAAKDLNANQADMLKFTDGVSLAMKASGQSATESAGALLQLSQALGGGKIQAEEYNSLLDGARPLLSAVAAGMKEAGGSVSALTNLVKTGKVSSEAFFRAFLAGLPTLQSQVASSETTISSSFVRLQNVLIDTAGKFNTSAEASKQFSSIVDQVAAEISSVNFDNLVTQIVAVTTAVQNSIATLNAWADKIGTISGLGSVGKSIMSLIPGDTVKFGGAYSQDAVQDRIDSAFGVPGANSGSGLSAAQIQSQTIDAIVKSPAVGGALTAAQIRAYANRTGAAQTSASPKADRVPATAQAVKPVSLADYAVPASAGKGSGGGSGGAKGRDSYGNELQQLQERTNALQAATSAQAALNPLVADYGQAVATAEARQKLLNAAQEQGKAVTPEMAAQIDAAAQAYGNATAAAKKLQEQQESVKQSAENALGTARDVTKGLITDLASGKSGAEALSNALSKIGDAILDNVLDKVFTLQNFGGIFGGLFGGGQASLAASGSIVGLFADGGYTGDGGKYEPKGIVHGGEYVLTKEATRRIGVGNLDAMQRGAMRGYASGGYVGNAPSIRKPDLKAANGNGATVQQISISAPVTVNGSAGTAQQNQDLAERTAKEMEQTMRAVVADEFRRQSRPGNLLNNRGR